MKNLKTEMASKKRQAAYLFIVKGYQLNSIAKMIGVSETTMSTWNKKYQWRDKVTIDLNLKDGCDR